MVASIRIPATPELQYLLRLSDTCLILGQRLGEWCGHAPILEEDIALSNMALDLIGQSRALLTLAGQRSGEGYDEDQLAFLRDEIDYRNPTLVELPRGDFAFTVLRNLIVSTWLRLMWERLRDSERCRTRRDRRQGPERRRAYHQQHGADWAVRRGRRHRRTRVAAARPRLATLWLYTPELFEDDAVDAAAVAASLGPAWSQLREPWLAEMNEVLGEAKLAIPGEAAFRSSGKRGLHSEHMGYLLAEMQHLQRSYPGGAW